MLKYPIIKNTSDKNRYEKVKIILFDNSELFFTNVTEMIFNYRTLSQKNMFALKTETGGYCTKLINIDEIYYDKLA